MKYRKIYSFQVFDRVENGEKVFMLDRELKRIFTVNETPVGCIVRATTAEDKEGRYEFWYVEEEDDAEL